MGAVQISGMSKSFSIDGRTITALNDIGLEIEEGRFVALAGKSGSGKTTLLRIIAGLEHPSVGEISFSRPNVKVGVVFQEPRLMPWLNVEQNILLPLINISAEQARETVAQTLSMLGLSSFAKAYPHQLSRGMAQRVALGRTLCYNPDLILMDEPLGALDAFTRRTLQDEIVRIFLAHDKTVLFVTHDIEEAVFMAQQVIVLDAGKIIGAVDIPFSYPRDREAVNLFHLRQDILRLIYA